MRISDVYLFIVFLGITLPLSEGKQVERSSGELNTNVTGDYGENYEVATHTESLTSEKEFQISKIYTPDELQTEETSYKLLKVSPPNHKTFELRPSTVFKNLLMTTLSNQKSAKKYNFSSSSSPSNIPGLSEIPITSFSCVGKLLDQLYPDFETNCQVFHTCQSDGRKSSFLCPNGTMFDSHKSICEWWYDVECVENKVNDDDDLNGNSFSGIPNEGGFRQGREFDVHESETESGSQEDSVDIPHHHTTEYEPQNKGLVTTLYEESDDHSSTENSEFFPDQDTNQKEDLSDPVAKSREDVQGYGFPFPTVEGSDVYNGGENFKVNLKIGQPDGYVDIDYGTEGYNYKKITHENLNQKVLNRAPVDYRPFAKNYENEPSQQRPLNKEQAPKEDFYAVPQSNPKTEFENKGIVTDFHGHRLMKPTVEYHGVDRYRYGHNSQPMFASKPQQKNFVNWNFYTNRGDNNQNLYNRQNDPFRSGNFYRRPGSSKISLNENSRFKSKFINGWRGYNNLRDLKLSKYQNVDDGFHRNRVLYPSRVPVSNAQDRFQTEKVDSYYNVVSPPKIKRGYQHASILSQNMPNNKHFETNNNKFQTNTFYPPLLKRANPYRGNRLRVKKGESFRVYREPGTTSYLPIFQTETRLPYTLPHIRTNHAKYITIGPNYNQHKNDVQFQYAGHIDPGQFQLYRDNDESVYVEDQETPESEH